MTITITKFESTNQTLFDAVAAMYSLYSGDNNSVDRQAAISELRKLANMLESGAEAPDIISKTTVCPYTSSSTHDMFIVC